MNKKILSVFCFIFLFSTVSASGLEETVNKKVTEARGAKKQAYLIGGSCDFANNFIEEFNHWNAFLLKKKWNIRGFISKDKTTQIKDVRPFEYDVFLEEISSLKNNPPKQLFIGIFTHGDKSHGICDDSREFQPISSLNPLLEDLHKQGVKIGVYDASCYSGMSVRQLDSSVYCVVSAAQENQSGSGAITTPQAQSLSREPALSKKMTLEDVWFGILSFSFKSFRQLPGISNWGASNTVLAVDLRRELEASNTALFRGGQLVSITQNLEAVDFIDRNKENLHRVFSPEALASAKDIFASGGYFWARHTVVPGIYYLLDNPKRQDRICANFVF